MAVAEAQEALIRTDAGLALAAAMHALADARLAARVSALAAYRAQRSVKPLRRRGRFMRRFEGVLGRLRWPGRAALIALSGLWTLKGPALRKLASYARGRAQAPASDLLFDETWYREASPDMGGLRGPGLVHYLVAGAAEGRAPHLLFHPGYYSRVHAEDLARHGLTPLEHYMARGQAMGESPHPAFDVGYYLAQWPDLRPDEDPVSHYLQRGWRAGLSPHPLFDVDWVRGQTPVEAQGSPPLAWYLADGWRLGVSPHPLFDSAWYLDQNPDVAAGGEEPLTHYLVYGAQERRDPSPWFDAAWYAAQRGDELAPEGDPLSDYLNGGAWAVAEPRPGFAGAAYLIAHPELARDATTPLEHWARLSRAGAR